MMELADMRDLGSRAERRAGSTPVTRMYGRGKSIFAAASFLTEVRFFVPSPKTQETHFKKYGQSEI